MTAIPKPIGLMMTKLENFQILNVSKYEYDWNKLERLQVRRVVIQLFLNSDTFQNIEECGRHVFEKFGATQSFVHPFLPCLKHGYTKKKYFADVVLPEYASLMVASKKDFIAQSMKRIKNGEKLDSLLYVSLMWPKLKFSTNQIDMLSTFDVAYLQKHQKPKTAKVTLPIEIVEDKTISEIPIVQPTTSSKDFEELTINVLYLKDKIDALISEQQTTQKMLQEFMDMQVNANWMAKNNTNIVTTTPTAPKRRNKVLVVGMWPRQFESLRLSFAPDFWDHFDISYISSDIIRKDKLENSGAYDHVFVNTTAINHTMEQIVRANCDDFIRYTGGVSALRTLLLDKAKSCEFGSSVRDNINNWIL